MGNKVLIAIELDDHSAHTVLNKAKAAGQAGDTFDVVHVVDPSFVPYTADPTMTGAMYQQAFDNAIDKAQARLEEICKDHDIAPDHCLVRYGRIAHEVHELVNEAGYDVLMIGSHGWSGWRRILGSKASSIMHGVPVDTWVFKVGEQPS